MNLINTIILQLEQKGFLSKKNNPHKLTGDYKGFWECHIQSDWLLVWSQNEISKTITLTRTGTHSDLF